MNKDRNTHSFIGCDCKYDEAAKVIFGAPYDGTASFRPGARFGPGAMRSESFGIETYSPYLNRDLTDLSVYDGGDLELSFGDPEPVLETIESYARQLFNDGKQPVMLGGEHLVTLGVVRAAFKKHPRLCMLHFDAHADLRDHYIGQKLSHACVIRRCHELLGDFRIFQYGIRSGDRNEFLFAQKHVYCHRFDFEGLETTVMALKGLPVYLSIDLDVLDPSELCGTGTPEAGGVSFPDMLRMLKIISPLNIVAADINELAPELDHSGRSTALACKLLRELLLTI